MNSTAVGEIRQLRSVAHASAAAGRSPRAHAAEMSGEIERNFIATPAARIAAIAAAAAVSSPAAHCRRTRPDQHGSSGTSPPCRTSSNASSASASRGGVALESRWMRIAHICLLIVPAGAVCSSPSTPSAPAMSLSAAR